MDDAQVPVTVDVQRDDAAVRLLVRGELDAAAGGELGIAIEAALADGARAVVVDLAGVTFMDSGGVATLLVARRQATTSEHVLSFEGIGPGLQRFLQAAGLAAVFDHDGDGVGGNGCPGCSIEIDTTRGSSGVTRITVAGELDDSSLPEVRRQIERAAAAGLVELDLGGVEVASSEVGRLLLGPLATNLALVAASPAVERAVAEVSATMG